MAFSNGIFLTIVICLHYEPHYTHGFMDSVVLTGFERPGSVMRNAISRDIPLSAEHYSVCAPTLRQDTQQLSPLGPPDYLCSLPIDQNLGPSLSRDDNFGVEQEFEVLHLSENPQIYLLRNYISTLERYTLQLNARNHPKKPAVYRHDDKSNDSGRSHSNVSWLPSMAANGIPLTLARCSAQLLLSPEMKENNQGGIGLCEPMQLVHYDSEGEFILHHDLAGRAMTVLCYLNGVAGTWFPLANFDPTERGGDIPQTKAETLQMIEDYDLQPGQDGLLLKTAEGMEDDHSNSNNDAIVSIHPGDAVVFYNCNGPNEDTNTVMDNDLGDIDWRAIHAALPAPEEKFIATLWYHIDQTSMIL